MSADGLRQKSLGSLLGVDKVSRKEGVKNLLDFLDNIYKKGTFVKLYNTYKKVKQVKQGVSKK